MRLPALLAILTLVTLAFAGCAGNDGDGDGTSSSTSTSTGPTTSGSSSTSPSGSATTTTTSGSSSTSSTGPANAAPTGSISASVNGTAVAFSLTGTDGDHDTLVWDLVFGDGATTNGTTLPASVNHTYAVGNHTAAYTITDGTATASYNVTVAVVAAGAGNTAIVLTGDVEPTCFILDLAFDAEPAWIGGAYTLVPDGVDVSWWIGEGDTDPIVDGGNSGTVPEGTTSAHICFDMFLGATTAATLTITPL